MNEDIQGGSYEKSLHPEAKEVGTWKYLWAHHKKEVFRSLLASLRDRPLFVVFCGVFFQSPSFYTLACVLLSLIISQFFNETIAQVGVRINQLKILNGALLPLAKKYDDLSISEFKGSAYLKKNDYRAYEDISYFLVQAFQKMLPGSRNRRLFTLDDMLTIYVLDTDQAILNNVSAFPSPLRYAIIIFDHEPDECGPFQNFTLLHEIGHAVLGVTKSTYFSDHGFKTIIFSLIVGLLCFEFNTTIWLLIAVYYILGYRERFFLSYTSALRDEMNCDMFALGYLNEDDLKRLSQIKGLKGRLSDENLTEKHNAIRLNLLEKALSTYDTWENGPWSLLEQNKVTNFKTPILKLLIMAGLLIAIGILAPLKASSPLTILIVLALLLVAAFFYSHWVTAKGVEYITDMANRRRPDKQ